jgi:tRNA(Ile)-lysidine synthase
MVEKIKNFITQNQLLEKEDAVLLAVSGGIDSMVMLHVFAKLTYSYAVAHVNHQTRGEENEKEEAFVRNVCILNDIAFHSTRFEISQKSEGNFHQNARAFRYQFFDDLCQSFNYNKIATAHHLDDSVEGFFLNLFRGAGLEGLSGMPAKRDHIIRPMLCLSRNEIEKYAEDFGLEYMEDSSNASLHYERNKLRHFLETQLYTSFPKARDKILDSMDNLSHTNKLLCVNIDFYKQKYINKNNNVFEMRIDEIQNMEGGKSLLFLILRDFGVNSAVAANIFHCRDKGAVYITNTHKIYFAGDTLHLISLQDFVKNEKTIEINGAGIFKISDFETLKIEKLAADSVDFNKPNTEYLSLSQENFPLTLRRWMPGDSFRPLGFKQGRQKVKKFLTEKKISGYYKFCVRVLVSRDGDICCLPGLRIDDRYRVQATSKEIWEICLMANT